MKSFRKIIFWMHLVAGVVAGSIVLVMSVTGLMLAFEPQIVAYAERDVRIITPSPDVKPLGVEAVLAKVREAQPDARPTGIVLKSDPTASVTVNFGRDGATFVNPYTGEIVGKQSKTHDFMHKIEDWHRALGAQGENRVAGRAVTGACNLAFLFLVVSGFYLWWPRNWTKSALKSVTVFGKNLRGKARDWNWHNVIGFWCAPALFFIVLTGVIMSYPWANNLLYRVTGNEPPPPPQQRVAPTPPATPPNSQPGATEQRATNEPRRRGNAEGEKRESRPSPSFEGFDKLFAIAQQQMVGWKTITLRLSQSSTAPLVFTIDSGGGGRPDTRGQLTLDSKTGEIVKWEPFQNQNLGRQLRSWSRYVHTGEAGGIIGQIIAALVSAGAAVLVWTGISLALRRFFNRNKKKQPAAQAVLENAIIS